MELYDVNQLKDKGSFVLKIAQTQTGSLREHFEEIHSNYVACGSKIKKPKSVGERISDNINQLTAQRDHLRNELTELKKSADENNKKLSKINAMILNQEKTNATLLRQLKSRLKNPNISEDLKEKITKLLSGPNTAKVPSDSNHDVQ